MQKSILALIVCIFLTANLANAQRWKMRRYDISLGAGTAQMFGDIGGAPTANNWLGLRDLQFNENNLAYGLGLRYKITTDWSARFNVAYTNKLTGSDDDTPLRPESPRSYTTKLYEFSSQAEYYLLNEERVLRSGAMYNRRGMVNNYATFALYLYAGVGGAYSTSDHINPINWDFDGYSNKKYVGLRPSEDLLLNNKNFTGIATGGVGVKYIIDDQFFINAELGYRYGLNDYLEGYTQLIGSKWNDTYYVMLISINYRMETSRRNIPVFLDRRYRNTRRN